MRRWRRLRRVSAERGIATLRYQFPYMEKGSKRPDAPAVAHAAVRAAVAEAARRCPALPLIAGGKSFGGRMTSQAQALAPCRAFAGWRFSAFRCIRPESLPATAPSISPMSEIPMLFLQGTRDALAELSLLEACRRRAWDRGRRCICLMAPIIPSMC